MSIITFYKDNYKKFGAIFASTTILTIGIILHFLSTANFLRTVYLLTTIVSLIVDVYYIASLSYKSAKYQKLRFAVLMSTILTFQSSVIFSLIISHFIFKII